MPVALFTNINTVETWSHAHTAEEIAVIEAKREEMFGQGKLARKYGTVATTKLEDGSEITTSVKFFWKSAEAANEYAEFLNTITPPPASVVVNL